MAKPIVDPSRPFVYASDTVPNTYVCGVCGKGQVKLWRGYQTFLDRQTLRCVDCAARSQQKDISTMDDNGKYTTDIGLRSDSIGWLVPAIPTEQNNAFWGYTSVPPEGVAWWQRLPLR